MHREICDFALECVANSLEAGASVVRLAIDEERNRLEVVVEDDGRGIGPEEVRAARDPFFTGPGKHPARRVGLGLPFLAQAVEIAGGMLALESELGKGTRVRFGFDLGNLDAPPAGDVAALMLHSLCFEGDYELEAERRREGRGYRLRRSQVREALGGLETVGDLVSLKEYLVGCEADLGGPGPGVSAGGGVKR